MVYIHDVNDLDFGETSANPLHLVSTPLAASVIVTIPDPGASCNVKLGISPIVVLPAAANTTITQAQSGSVFYIPQATANNTISLPALLAGLNFKFIVQATADGTHTNTIAATAAICSGNITSVAAGLTATLITTKTNLILSATAANVKPGDYADFYCDGTNWWIRAYTAGTAAGWSSS